MWAARYWPSSYFADRYWVKSSTGAVIVANVCVCAPYGDGTPYGDGEKYCDSSFSRRAYFVRQDVLCHNLAFRFVHTGKVNLDAIFSLVKTRKTIPFNYEVICDQTAIKRLSIRVQAIGCMRLDRLLPVIKTKNQQPIA